MTRTTRTRRLREAVIFAAARGAATATGSFPVALAMWWFTHHGTQLLTCLQAAAGQLS